MPKILTPEERAKKWAKLDKKRIRTPSISQQADKRYSIIVLKRTELYDALEKAIREYDKRSDSFLRRAVVEKLQRDGYLRPDFEEHNHRRTH